MPPLVYELLLLYISIISLSSVIVTVYDKIAATRRPDARIREATLLTLSVLGGSVAMYLTMQIIHHKTKHAKFMIGIPLIMVLHAALVICYFYFLK